MKYIRFTQVDSKTKKSINVERSVEGPTWPDLKGLNVLFQDTISSEFWYGTVDDDATDDPENQCWILTQEELSDYVKMNIDKVLEMYKSKLYEEEKQVRNLLLGKYDATASLAGIYKYDQALTLLADNNADAPIVREEAAARGIDPVLMAERIKINHENFRVTEAKIAGVRGKLLDRLDAYQFDSNDPIASWDEFMKTEIVGQKTEFNNNLEIPESVIVDVLASYYGTDIGIRLAFME